MRLNTLKPRAGSKQDRKRVGRGIGSTHGKTCGRGHKGQKSRSGGLPRTGFEGGQMPLQRRLPKVGFRSRMAAQVTEVRLHELQGVSASPIDLAALRAAKLIGSRIERVKVIASGKLDKAVTLKGLGLTKGAREAVVAAGGRIED